MTLETLLSADTGTDTNTAASAISTAAKRKSDELRRKISLHRQQFPQPPLSSPHRTELSKLDRALDDIESEYPQDEAALKAKAQERLHIYIKDVLHLAIAGYEKKYPRRAAGKRQKNIQELKSIIDHSQNYDGLTRSLEEYFQSNEYYRGHSNQSELEDMIIKCLWDNDELVQQACEIFGDPSIQHPAPLTSSVHTVQTAYEDQEYTLSYTFNDFIEYAIDKYCEEESIDRTRLYDVTYEHPKKFRIDNILQIKKLLVEPVLSTQELSELSSEEQATETIKRRLANIRNYINGPEFTHSFRSDLKSYITDVVSYYEKLFEKREDKTSESIAQKAKIRFWKSPDGNTKNLVLFLHGWGDCVEAGNLIGKLFKDRNFNMYSYDHWGHGFDNERWSNTFPSIPPDLLCLQFRKFLEAVSPSFDNVFLVGHSLGGAVLAAEHEYIERQDKVRTVSLLTPAISSNVLKLLDLRRLAHPALHPETSYRIFRHSEPAEPVKNKSVPPRDQAQQVEEPVPAEASLVPPSSTARTTKKEEKRMGSDRFRLFHSLLPFMRRAFNALVRFFNKKIASSKKWTFHVAINDRYRLKEEAETLEELHNKQIASPDFIPYGQPVAPTQQPLSTPVHAQPAAEEPAGSDQPVAALTEPKTQEKPLFKSNCTFFKHKELHSIPWTRYPHTILGDGVVKPIVEEERQLSRAAPVMA